LMSESNDQQRNALLRYARMRQIEPFKHTHEFLDDNFNYE
jgi:hypothetical protein